AANAVKLVVAFDENVAVGLGQVAPGDVEWNAGAARVALHLGAEGTVLGLRPWLDRTLIQGEGWIGDDEVHVEVDGVAEALALRTRAVWIVKGEETRLGLVVREMTVLAFEALRETESFARCVLFAGNGFENHFARFAVGRFNGINDTR